MSADHDIHFAVGAAFSDFGVFAVAAQAADRLYVDRPLGEAVAKGVEMLLGQKGGGYQDDDLFIVLCRNKGGAHSDLGFAKTDIPAYQTVHSALRCKIVKCGIDGILLIAGDFKRKFCSEFFIVG